MRSGKTALGLIIALCMGTSILSINSPAKAATPEKTITAIQNTYDLTSIKDLDYKIQRQVICLALNLYHEARGTSNASVMAVGFSTKNRIDKTNEDYCTVIWEKGQYVWTKRPIHGQMPKDTATWSKIMDMAKSIVTIDSLQDTTSGADSFYSSNLPHAPRWAKNSPVRVRVGKLVFVKQLD